MALLKMQNDARVDATFIMPTHKPYVHSLHKTINEVIDGDYDYWITFDDDNPPRANPFDLVFLNKDIIGCPTPVWQNHKPGDYPLFWNALKEDGDGWTPHKTKRGLQEVDAVGSGCLVVGVWVLKQMAQDPPHERWFFREWNDSGEVEKGGDFMFCKRAKRHGFSVWAHYDYPCYHFNEVELGEVNSAYMEVSQ